MCLRLHRNKPSLIPDSPRPTSLPRDWPQRAPRQKNTVSFATVYTGIEHVTFKARVNMHIALVRYRVTIFTFYKPGRIKVFRVTVLGAPPKVIRAFC